ncbi:hypothetical protein [Mucilaginibacter sp. 22184]|uniref:hypothetical protein n=1 Tax=Mucilaginibacter sp. 22184 TaxID=3453887 RepID=UPI003F82B26D
MIDINFGSLFTVELLHSYYKDQLCPDFNILPSNQTVKTLGGHQIIARQYSNQLITGVNCNGKINPPKPFTAIETGAQFTFFMQLNNPLFFNYTNLSSATPGKIYYFTNRNNNVSNGKTFLSSKIAVYNAANTYAPGDLVSNGTGITYRAIGSSKPGNTFNLTNANHWMVVDKNQYLTEADALKWMPSISAYQFASPQASVNISVLGYDNIATTYTQSVFSKTIAFANPASSFPLDLSFLQSGKYSLTVNGIQQWIYINDELSDSKTFAVIDIFNDASPVSCNLIDGSGALINPAPHYSIYFLNRATIWKYILASKQSGNINDTANLYHFANPASVITSLTPIPLSNKALNLKLTLNNHDYSPIACADPQRLVTITKGTDTYPCSEIFLNF